MRAFIALLAALLLAGPALATSSLTVCGTTDVTTDVSLSSTECVAWRFTLVEDSPGIAIQTPTGLICFDPNTATDGVATGQVYIRFCPAGVKPSSNPENTCGKISDTPMTGLTGAASTQDWCQRVGPGTYWSDVEVSPGGQSAVVYFRGEGGQ